MEQLSDFPWTEVVLAVIGSGILTRILVTFGERRQRAASTEQTEVATLQSVTDTLKGEIDRLAQQVNVLNVLVGALEDELVILGGDPLRVRRRVAEQLADPEH